jgi:hypothetical protein
MKTPPFGAADHAQRGSVGAIFHVQANPCANGQAQAKVTQAKASAKKKPRLAGLSGWRGLNGRMVRRY